MMADLTQRSLSTQNFPYGTSSNSMPYVFNCTDGLILPCWNSDGTLQTMIIHGLVYVIVLLYIFVGMAIISDRFMESIEYITSQEKDIVVRGKDGSKLIKTIRVWNDTLANLTLMALGSSAPEIIFSSVEIYAQNFQSGELGPSTIVGSAAFNMFFILALCVVVSRNVKKIKHFRVVIVTFTFSVLAYIVLIVILVGTSPGVIEVWEGMFLLALFAFFLVIAYMADRRMFICKFIDSNRFMNSRRSTQNCDSNCNKTEGVMLPMKILETESAEVSRHHSTTVSTESNQTINDPSLDRHVNMCDSASVMPNRINSIVDSIIMPQQSDNNAPERISDDNEAETFSNVISRNMYSFANLLTIFWKAVFYYVPSTTIWNGWARFAASIFWIGFLTVLVNDIAEHLGRTIHLKDSVTAITLIALGTSMPDTFASMIAAQKEKYADNSIGNVTGSNAVNVFLGIGVAWTMAAVYHAFKGTPGGFRVEPGDLVFSVSVYVFCAAICAVLFIWRRHKFGGELGGPLVHRIITAVILVGLWLFYIIISILKTYNVINVIF